MILLCHAFDDAQVALGGLAEHLERGLIALAVVGRDSALDAVELDHNHALGNPGLVRFRRVPAGQEAPACGGNGRSRELRVGGERIRIGDGTIERDPIGLRHETSSLGWNLARPAGAGSLAHCLRPYAGDRAGLAWATPGGQRFHTWSGVSALPWRACARYSERRMIDTVSPAPASPAGIT